MPNFFACRLRALIIADDASSPILDHMSAAKPWNALTGGQRSNLLDAAKTGLLAAFTGMAYNTWDSLTLTAAGAAPTAAERETFIHARFDDASAAAGTYTILTASEEVEYAFFDNKVICEHYYAVDKTGNPWVLAVSFPDGAGNMWTANLDIWSALRHET